MDGLTLTPLTNLSVNINKIALLRNSRGRDFPSVVSFSRQVLELGAHGITLHPRPDQRHARYSDVSALRELLQEFPGAELNVEGYPSRELLDVILAARPHQCTLVPDAPGQLTTDHGWNLRGEGTFLRSILRELQATGIRSSVFVDHHSPDIPLARELGADRIELYTEPYDSAPNAERGKVRDAFGRAAALAQHAGLGVNAGHDLNLGNLADFLEIPGILEVSIGHALIVECIDQGLDSVIRAYLELCHRSR